MAATLAARKPVVGLVFPGDMRLSSSASGVPLGVTGGMAALGVDVVHVEPYVRLDSAAINVLAAITLPRAWNGDVRRSLSVSRRAARANPLVAAIHSWGIGRNLERVMPVDGLVQLGTGFTLPPGIPTVTYEDMTVAQAVKLGYPQWRALPERAVAARIELQRTAYERARACCTRTRWAAESIVSDYGVPPSKVRVVGIGRNHSPRPAPRDWSTPRFLFVGYDWRRKNGDAVVRAFTEMRKADPTARLDLVGHHPRIEIEGVHGHGPLPADDPEGRATLEGLFRSATCFVMPSLYEPAGIVYAEAAAAGLPSIGTTVGGAGEVIGDAGRVVDPADATALVQAMRDLSKPDTAAELGARAESRSELFTWQAVAGRLLRALELPGTDPESQPQFL